ncbi:CCA tRNA nucleotidyltransferase [Myxococcota bacterium]|nr:CCA tRNA nucleotidyltransferase [Myxococcota bacterium]MBU1382001.1 CCA tRNA nucleotidyltransferase [Myxococcota bacterium]MBU1497662.1 CCA tRNA nucleotidyltransferase [Myxococcota bacterium]
MKIVVPHSDLLFEKACAAVSLLRKHGFESYFAGGCVRDLIMGRSPIDYDIATAAKPEDVTEIFKKTVTVGAAFGVVVVIFEGFTFEVATFRNDNNYIDGRRPESVTFSTAREDVLRRDFTINGLLLDPETGNVFDYIDGIKDIERRVIRAIGDPAKRFGEDQLRILRAIRFAARLDFSIDPETWDSICCCPERIRNVSWERVRDEIEKTITNRGAGKGLRLLKESGLLEIVLPEVKALDGVEQNPEFHPEGDCLEHTIRAFESNENWPLEPILAWALLFHDTGKKDAFTINNSKITFYCHESIGSKLTEKALFSLRLSRNAISDISSLVADHMKLMHISQMKDSSVKRLMGRDLKSAPDLEREYFRLLCELNRLDNLNSPEKLSDYFLALERMKAIPVGEEKPAPLLSGDDILSMGVPQGPAIGKILKLLMEGQLDGRIIDKESAEAFARAIINGTGDQ